MIGLVFALLLQSQSSSPARATTEAPTFSAPQPHLPPAQLEKIPRCTAEMLYLTTDGENGTFNGMSQGGTLLVIRNEGPAACQLVPMADATLLDKDGKTLTPFATEVPGTKYMHPGPVVLPVAIAAGAELTARMHWVAGQVFAQNVCLDPATLVLRFGDVTLRTPMGGHLCGERGKGVVADLPKFALDPVVPATGDVGH